MKNILSFLFLLFSSFNVIAEDEILRKTNELKEYCFTQEKISKEVLLLKIKALSKEFENSKEFERHINREEMGCIFEVLNQAEDKR